MQTYKRVTITINIEPPYDAGLRKLAKREGRSVSAYLRQRVIALVAADPTVLKEVADEARALSVAAVHDESVHTARVAQEAVS